jgi:hypothetical protein
MDIHHATVDFGGMLPEMLLSVGHHTFYGEYLKHSKILIVSSNEIWKTSRILVDCQLLHATTNPRRSLDKTTSRTYFWVFYTN